MTWLKNTAGKPDAMLTMAAAAFLVASMRLLGSGVTVGPVALSPVDGGLLAAYLAPTLGAYVARRLTDAKRAASNPSG